MGIDSLALVVRQPACRRTWQRGFTLVELLVVIAIIGILVALLLPAVQAAREAARRTQCLNNVKQQTLGCHMYADAHKTFPIGANWENQLAWRVYTLPYIDQAPLYDIMKQYNAFEPGTVDKGSDNGGESYPTGKLHRGQYFAAEYRVGLFLCPSHGSEEELATKGSAVLSNGKASYSAHYLGAAGPAPDPNDSSTTGVYRQSVKFPGVTKANQTAWTSLKRGGSSDHGLLVYGVEVKPSRATDGLSNTLMIGEAYINDVDSSTGDAWVRGVGVGYTVRDYMASTKNIRYAINTPQDAIEELGNNVPFGSSHPGGAHFAMGDGSGKLVSEDIDMIVYRAAASRDVGETAVLQ